MQIDDINNEINNIINNNKLNYINSFYLSNKEIEVLKKYNIDYKNSINLKEIIYKLSELIDSDIDEEEYNEIDQILESISTRDYYQNTNK